MAPSSSETKVPMFVTPQDYHLYKSAKFIDVREPSAYAEGHIKNAVNAYDLFTYLLATSTKDDINEMKSYFQRRFAQLGITGSEHVIVYEQCMDKQYGASSRGFFILKFMKHPNVSILDGGFNAFIHTEHGAQNVTTEPTTILTCKYQGDDTNDEHYQMADRDEVAQLVNHKKEKCHLMDVRDAIEWTGLSSSPYGADFTPRKGRIPNSVWVEWYEFHQLNEEQNEMERKSNEQIESLMKSKGIAKNDQIIIYCFKGSRASVALMSLKLAGYRNVKNYFASWNEWSRDFQLPIDDEVYHRQNI